MRFYLSSFKLGEQSHLLVDLYGNERPLGYIANALDHVTDTAWLEDLIASDMGALRSVGLQAQRLDLREFFGSAGKLRAATEGLSGLWVSGGNVFVLRQAMNLSGLDEFLRGPSVPDDFTYGGYSAGCCVLSPSLKPYAIVDDSDVKPYPQISEILWDGLGILDFAFMPHFQSNHSESDLIEKEIEFCVENNIAYRTFQDGDVLLL